MVHLSKLALICVAFAAQSVMAAPACPAPAPEETSQQNKKGIEMPKEFEKYQRQYQTNLKQSLPCKTCTEKTLGIRKSWDEIDDEQRSDYIRAVHCLAGKPAKTDKKLAPGMVNRLDDFTYNHINQTNIIHNSGYLLPWHRLFLWNFEQAMRNECGYKSYLPYWDNARFSENQLDSKVWDGSATSFGGNGKYLENDHGPFKVILPGLAPPNANFTLPKPAGTGGGCIQDGPFKNFTISLGPVAKAVIDKNNKYGYQANPRCLSRNFDPTSSKGITTWGNATTIVSSKNISELRNNIELYWHKNSHTFIGKEGADPFSTTNDPAFYLLHAQIDRLWAIWQGQDLAKNTYTIDGNRTFLGLPLDDAPNVPSTFAELDDVMDMGLNGKVKARDGMGMTENGMCYLYE